MKFKKTFLIICVMCLFVSLAGAYADDINDTPISKTNETQRELSDDGKLSEIHQQDNGTFEALDEKISSAPSGSVVYLENDYTAESDRLMRIDIKNSITIDGQGHKIDAKHKGAVFSVRADNVFIKNVTFLNGNGGGGVAISWDGHNGRLSDCVFSNNIGSYGTAVYWRGLDAVISGCVFQNNTATDNAVLFCEEGKVRISDCVFKDNVANFSSAIFFEGEECLITGCTFINNTSEMSGTISVWDSFEISGCVFIENKGEHVIDYGSIRVNKINNNMFLNNRVSDSIFLSVSDIKVDYNWFGNTADNFKDLPSLGNASSEVWLFLNATAKPDTIPVGAASEVKFKLYAYNSTSKTITDYDSSLLRHADLKITASNGNADRTVAHFNEPIRFSTVNAGPASVIAAIGDFRFKADLNVIQAKTKITAMPVKAVYNKNKNLVVTLTDENGSPIKGARIIITLNGAKTYITDKNGQVKVNVAKFVPKTYNVKIRFVENLNFRASQKTVKVTVKKAASKILAKKKTFKANKKVKKYKITLKSGKTPIKKVKLTLKIKGKTYKAKTNKKGKATFKIKLAKKGKFKAVIKFKANKYYKAITKKVKITIK